MTLDDALAQGKIETPQNDLLRGCRTASAIEPETRCLYTVIETPIGGRSWSVYGSSAIPASYNPSFDLESLDWEPGVANVHRFWEEHSQR